MRIGRMRHYVTIQTPDSGVDSSGSPKNTWSDVASVPAFVSPFTARERTQGNQVAATTTHEVHLRYRDDVTPKNRLTWNGAVLEIDSVIDTRGLHHELVLLCRQKVL